MVSNDCGCISRMLKNQRYNKLKKNLYGKRHYGNLTQMDIFAT